MRGGPRQTEERGPAITMHVCAVCVSNWMLTHAHRVYWSMFVNIPKRVERSNTHLEFSLETHAQLTEMKAYLRNIELAPKQLASGFILIYSVVGPTSPKSNTVVVDTVSPMEGFPDSCCGWGGGRMRAGLLVLNTLRFPSLEKGCREKVFLLFLNFLIICVQRSASLSSMNFLKLNTSVSWAPSSPKRISATPQKLHSAPFQVLLSPLIHCILNHIFLSATKDDNDLSCARTSEQSYPKSGVCCVPRSPSQALWLCLYFPQASESSSNAISPNLSRSPPPQFQWPLEFINSLIFYVLVQSCCYNRIPWIGVGL